MQWCIKCNYFVFIFLQQNNKYRSFGYRTDQISIERDVHQKYSHVLCLVSRLFNFFKYPTFFVQFHVYLILLFYCIFCLFCLILCFIFCHLSIWIFTRFIFFVYQVFNDYYFVMWNILRIKFDSFINHVFSLYLLSSLYLPKSSL